MTNKLYKFGVREYTTRGGYRAVVTFKLENAENDNEVLVGWMEYDNGKRSVCTWTEFGFNGTDAVFDLMPPIKTVKRWVGLDKNGEPRLLDIVAATTEAIDRSTLTAIKIDIEYDKVVAVSEE